MKKAYLPLCLLLLLSGCKTGEVQYCAYDHNAWKDHINYREAEVTLKEGKICFSPMDAEDVSKEQVPVGLIRIFWGPKEAWLKTWDKEVFLSGDECVPYDGVVPLKNNTFYFVNLAGFVEQTKNPGIYAYVKVFCLPEGKDGEAVVHQFPLEKLPATCPAPEAK
jgi:hypothetical protein